MKLTFFRLIFNEVILKSSSPGVQPHGCRMGYVNTFQFDQLNMRHLCELRQRKKVFKNVENLFLKPEK